MLEVYCDASFRAGGASYVGCAVLKDGVMVCQSTARVLPEPLRNTECERAAIDFGIAAASLFPDPVTVIYNDSSEAVREYGAAGACRVEYAPRDAPYQSLADRLSRRFPQGLAADHGLCRKPVEPFTPGVLASIARGAPVLYLKKIERETTNTRAVYSLVVRTIDRVLSDTARYEARAGEARGIKAALEAAADLSDPGFVARIGGPELEGAYFLITDETWGLRLKGGEAYSILPGGVGHHVVCHEVDRRPENLFRRAGEYR